MKVMRFNDSVGAPALLPADISIPQPGPGELLVRIRASGVTPTELQWYPTTHTKDGGVRSGAVPGHEFSGIVETVGADVDPVLMGTEVYGMNDWFAEGSTAEYCVTLPGSVASKPATLDHITAASVPIGALTAWQGLFQRAKLQAGERILVHGGAGSVGVFATQLARRAGAHVIVTASPRNFEFLTHIGADETIDYHSADFGKLTGSLDVVFDSVGGKTLDRSWDLLKASGRIVTIATESEGTKDARIEKAFFIVEPDRNQLTEIARLIDKGELKPFVDAVVPFEKASDAYCGTVEHRTRRGKMVLAVA